MTEEKLRLSYSKANTVRRCGQEYIWKYDEGLIPKQKAFPLKLGDIVHFLLHGYDKNELTVDDIQDYKKVFNITKEKYPDDEEDVLLDITSQASTLCSGYLDRYKQDDLKIIAGETMLEVDVGDYILVGIVDAWARPEQNKLWRLERKTAARMDANYLNGFKSGLQGAIYDFLSEALFKEKLQGTIYDLIIKTKIPKYERAYTKCNRTSIDLMLKCLDGVAKDIRNRNLYPDPSACFRYNSECPYRVLCTFDSPTARESFFTKRKEEDAEQSSETGETVE